jgi:hypothetical protein
MPPPTLPVTTLRLMASTLPPPAHTPTHRHKRTLITTTTLSSLCLFVSFLDQTRRWRSGTQRKRPSSAPQDGSLCAGVRSVSRNQVQGPLQSRSGRGWGVPSLWATICSVLQSLHRCRVQARSLSPTSLESSQQLQWPHSRQRSLQVAARRSAHPSSRYSVQA